MIQRQNRSCSHVECQLLGDQLIERVDRLFQRLILRCDGRHGIAPRCIKIQRRLQPVHGDFHRLEHLILESLAPLILHHDLIGIPVPAIRRVRRRNLLVRGKTRHRLHRLAEL